MNHSINFKLSPISAFISFKYLFGLFRKKLIELFGYFQIRWTPIVSNFKFPVLPKRWGSNNSDRAPKIPNFFEGQHQSSLTDSRYEIMYLLFELLYQNCLFIHPKPFSKVFYLPHIWACLLYTSPSPRD